MAAHFNIDGEEKSLEVTTSKKDLFVFKEENNIYSVKINSHGENHICCNINDEDIEIWFSGNNKGAYIVSAKGVDFEIERTDILNTFGSYEDGEGENANGNFCSPMPGKVLKVNVKEGEKVVRGSILIVVEAMKMENNIVATEDAIIEKVAVKEGEMVDANTQLIYLKTENN